MFRDLSQPVGILFHTVGFVPCLLLLNQSIRSEARPVLRYFLSSARDRRRRRRDSSSYQTAIGCTRTVVSLGGVSNNRLYFTEDMGS